jgi:hypothetical protein
MLEGAHGDHILRIQSSLECNLCARFFGLVHYSGLSFKNGHDHQIAGNADG